MELPRQFRVTKITLENIETTERAITFEYGIDDHTNVLRFEYDTISLHDVALGQSSDALHAYAVSLGVICLSNFGAVLPRYCDITKYGPWVHPHLLSYLRKILPHHWSEHRYQLDALDYHVPEFIFDEKTIGSKVTLPIWELDESLPRKVMVASGSGKDSLLCEKILEHGDIEHESFTYLHELYGDLARQKEIFERIPRSLTRHPKHVIKIYDDYDPWLVERLAQFRVVEAMKQWGIVKPFARESGEVLSGSFAMVPIQIIRSIQLQVFGNEKSADFPNLIEKGTGQRVSHQFGKSIYAEESMFKLYEKMFGNINRVSVTKPIHDAAIFKKLFELAGDLPYSTNSCNIKKPWCLKCEKCLYVFSGFVAFGDHQKTIDAFGKDAFDDLETLPIWEELLGLRDHIAWECVGHPEETQLYFYKVLNRGIAGCAIDTFKEKIIEPMKETQSDAEIDHHFSTIQDKYLQVYTDHHHMPKWLSDKVFGVLMAS